MKKINWIFFDIDNTLFDSHSLAKNARKNAVRAMIRSGLKAKPAAAFKKLMQIVKKYGSNYEGHFDKLTQSYRVPKEQRKRIVAAGIVEYHNTKFKLLKPFPKVKKTLRGLRAEGRRLGVITNGVAVKQWDKLIRLGLSNFFEIVVISEEVGSAKPAGKIFRAALKKAKCKAKEALMVGDSLIDKAAEKVGILAIIVKNGNFGKVLNEIKKSEK